MTGETQLSLLLRNMAPQLHDGEYVFCTLPPGTPVDLDEVIGSFREAEGLTVVLARDTAEALGWRYAYVAAWITLEVHSALEAVGLTAAFASALGAAGISCNVIAGYYHDHLFVAHEDAARAMAALRQLAAGA
ncbi:ACT domain-containing protein [Pseudomonas eucalypticola]|uniref:ACT domain-containing protein n=1 Tax=Pseudomonas eucalypticola TaxID=2599595 RepID=A0A7D5H0U4_9PSED|nr:ACT domain-containing protein [Pseudomonas eucalypticola]QKZ05067.1 ACT domain-containing protein [Pseudomonas eucalypticola]